MNNHELIEKNLSLIILELEGQPEISIYFSEGNLSYSEQIALLKEWVEYAGEYGIAYESIVCLLENCPFTLSGKAAVKLLELGLIFGFKTDLDEDRIFDRRKNETG